MLGCPIVHSAQTAFRIHSLGRPLRTLYVALRVNGGHHEGYCEHESTSECCKREHRHDPSEAAFKRHGRLRRAARKDGGERGWPPPGSPTPRKNRRSARAAARAEQARDFFWGWESLVAPRGALQGPMRPGQTPKHGDSRSEIPSRRLDRSTRDLRLGINSSFYIASTQNWRPSQWIRSSCRVWPRGGMGQPGATWAFAGVPRRQAAA